MRIPWCAPPPSVHGATAAGRPRRRPPTTRRRGSSRRARPRYDDARITTVEADWLENPSIGCRWKMRRPIVRTIVHPPMAVPSVSVAPEATLTQSGTESVSRRPPATRIAAVTPIAFWASLAPWLNESAADITHSPARTGPARRRVRPADGGRAGGHGRPERETDDRRHGEGDQDAEHADGMPAVEPAPVDAVEARGHDAAPPGPRPAHARSSTAARAATSRCSTGSPRAHLRR